MKDLMTLDADVLTMEQALERIQGTISRKCTPILLSLRKENAIEA